MLFRYCCHYDLQMYLRKFINFKENLKLICTFIMLMIML